MSRHGQAYEYGGSKDGGVGGKVIRSGSYNISNVSNGGLGSALWGMAQAKLDLGVFQEINVTNRFHMQDLAGYRVLANDVPIQHLEEVAVFYRDVPHLQVEAYQRHQPNVASFQLESDKK